VAASAAAAAAAAAAADQAQAAAEAQEALEKEWEATIARGEEIDWRVPRQPVLPSHGPEQPGPQQPGPPNLGGAPYGPPIAPHLDRREAYTRLNTPAGAAEANARFMTTLRTNDLRKMRKEVKWYKPKRGADSHSRLYRVRGTGSHGSTNLTVNEACIEIWERYKQDWREVVILRGMGEEINIPAGH